MPYAESLRVRRSRRTDICHVFGLRMDDHTDTDGVLPQRECYPESVLSRKAYYPVRRAIPEGVLSRKACYPGRCIIPEGMLSRKAYYPKRCVISEGK